MKLTLSNIEKNLEAIVKSGDEELVKKVAYKILIDGLNLLPNSEKSKFKQYILPALGAIAGVIAGGVLGGYAGGIPNRRIPDDPYYSEAVLGDYGNGSAKDVAKWNHYVRVGLPTILKTAGIFLGIYLGGILGVITIGGIAIGSWYLKRRKIKKWLRVAKKFFSYYGNKEVMKYLDNVEKSLNNKKTAIISLASFFGGLALSIIPGYEPTTYLLKSIVEVLKLDGIRTYQDFVRYATENPPGSKNSIYNVLVRAGDYAKIGLSKAYNIIAGFIGGLVGGIAARIGIRKSEEATYENISPIIRDGALELYNRGIFTKEEAERFKKEIEAIST